MPRPTRPKLYAGKVIPSGARGSVNRKFAYDQSNHQIQPNIAGSGSSTTGVGRVAGSTVLGRLRPRQPERVNYPLREMAQQRFLNSCRSPVGGEIGKVASSTSH